MSEANHNPHQVQHRDCAALSAQLQAAFPDGSADTASTVMARAILDAVEAEEDA